MQLTLFTIIANKPELHTPHLVVRIIKKRKTKYRLLLVRNVIVLNNVYVFKINCLSNLHNFTDFETVVPAHEFLLL